MIVSDNTIVAEGLGYFFKNLDKKDLIFQKRWQKMFWKTLEELLKVEQTLGPHMQLEARKQLYHHYQRWSIFITQEKEYTWANLYSLC